MLKKVVANTASWVKREQTHPGYNFASTADYLYEKKGFILQFYNTHVTLTTEKKITFIPTKMFIEASPYLH